jgi:adenylate cyclase
MTAGAAPTPATLTDGQRVAVLEVLQRALASGLVAGERQGALLTYLVTEELEGRGERLKAYTLATEVLKRDASFDPQSDSIVRVELARLRKTLALYEAQHGQHDPVRISIPKGGSRPAFHFTHRSEAAPTVGRSWLPGRRWLLPLVAALVLLVGVGLWPRTAQTPYVPRLGILPFTIASNVDGYDFLAAGLQTEVVGLLSGAEWLAVVPLDHAVTQPMQGSEPFSYLARLDLLVVDHRLRTTASLLDGRDGRVLWSKVYEDSLGHVDLLTVLRDMAARIAIEAGRPFGLIAQLEQLRLASGQLSDKDQFGCYLRALQFYDSYTAASYDSAQRCLRPFVVREPPSPPLMAALSMLLINRARYGGAESPRDALLAEASELAQKASALAPGGWLQTMASYTTALCRGEVEGFVRLGRAAAARFSANPALVSDVGTKLALGAGLWEEGLALVAQAQGVTGQARAWYALAPTIAALKAGDPARARKVLEQIRPASTFPPLVMLDLIVANREQNTERATAAAARLREIGFADRQAALDMVRRECWAPAVRELMLSEAGAALDAVARAGQAVPASAAQSR